MLALALLVAALGCDAPTVDPGVRAVPTGAFALVADRALGLDVLRRLSRERPVHEASQRLIADARLALESAERSPERARTIERGALARGLLDHLRRDALAKSPPDQAEIAQASQALWAELDRPRCVRTISVTALIPPLADGQRQERVMRRIAEQLQGSGTPEELAKRVERADKEGVGVEVVLLAPLTEDGRSYFQTPADSTGPVPPPEYARAAALLTYAGETSDLVATSVGYHVLMATDILPPAVVQEPERSRRLESAIADRRVATDLERLRGDLASRTTVWQSPHQSTLTSLVWRTQPGQ